MLKSFAVLAGTHLSNTKSNLNTHRTTTTTKLLNPHSNSAFSSNVLQIRQGDIIPHAIVGRQHREHSIIIISFEERRQQRKTVYVNPYFDRPIVTRDHQLRRRHWQPRVRRRTPVPFSSDGHPSASLKHHHHQNMMRLLAAILLTLSNDDDVVVHANDGFKKNSVSVATCDDSNLGSSGIYW